MLLLQHNKYIIWMIFYGGVYFICRRKLVNFSFFFFQNVVADEKSARQCVKCKQTAVYMTLVITNFLHINAGNGDSDSIHDLPECVR